jgi:hypothetical protein
LHYFNFTVVLGGKLICLFVRCGKQRLREARIQGVDYLILGLAGICLGTLAKVSDETFGALGYTYTVIAVCKFYTLQSDEQ